MHLPPRQIGCILFHKGYHFVDNCWKLGFVFLPITGESPASQLEKGSVPISHTVCCGLPSRCLECRASPRLWEGPSSQSWILLGSGAVLSPDSVGEIALGPVTEEYVTQSHYPLLSRRASAASVSQTVVSLAKTCSWATVSVSWFQRVSCECACAVLKWAAVSGRLGDSDHSLSLVPGHLLLPPCSGHRLCVTVVECLPLFRPGFQKMGRRISVVPQPLDDLLYDFVCIPEGCPNPGVWIQPDKFLAQGDWPLFIGSQWRRQWHPTPVLWPGKSHGQSSLVGCSPCSR